MRIAILTEVFLPKIDGITNRLRHTIDGFVDQGHEVLIFGPLHAQGSYRGVKVVQLPGIPFPPYPDLQVTHADPRILTRLLRFRPDIVHAVGPASLGVLGLVAARALGIPVVASYHTDLPAYLPKHGLDFATPAIWPVIRAVHNLAHVNLCPSSVTKAQLEEHGIPNVGIWRGGVDTKRFRPEAATVAMRRRLAGTDRLEEVRSLAIYVGRVSPEKNLERLFDLHDAIPGLHVAVVGDGPDRERLQQKASGRRIQFTGFLRGDDLAAAYASADFFYMPSTTETLGFVVLEAMSSGTPAVAASAGGSLYLVSAGENGLLFDPDVEGDDIRQVRELLANPSQHDHFARQARKFAEAGSWTQETQRLLRHYRRAIEIAERTDRLTRLRNLL
jgi:glycosyltransferase involved in cell wall biosynthesis